ncbi:MAG TPA: universal stress protein [Chitinophagaceae bacterium]|nr:universal stress protein [Chitinophagaceae bacterium]
MKKILLAFDGGNYSTAALEFAARLNERQPIFLTGAFLPQVDYANLWSYSRGGKSPGVYIPLVEDEDAEIVQQNIERFRSFCIHHHIEFRLHKDFFDFAIPELKKETRFADLLIISSETFYGHLATDEPNEYLQEALHSVECPVLVLPEHFEFPQSSILAYDGSASSVYAIKQFAYLLPELAGNETILAYAGKEDEPLPEADNIQELTVRHFSNLNILHLQADQKKYFAEWLNDKNAPVLVCGSYGRSAFSRLFKKSFINGVISNHQVPVFIAHRN